MKKYFLIFNLLNFKQRKFALLLLCLALVSTIFEALSIGIILPFIDILINENILLKYPFLENFLEIFPFFKNYTEKNQLLFFGCLFIFTVYSLKALILTISNLYQLKFIKDIDINWVKKLFNYYLNEEYIFFIKRNSAVLFRNISQCSVTANALKNIIFLFSEILILSGIIILLLFIDFVTTLVIFLFFLVVSSIIYIFTKKGLKNWGKAKHNADGQYVKNLQEGFGAVKEIKLQGNEDFFVDELVSSKSLANNVQFKKDFIAVLPKIWIELLAIISMFIFIILSLKSAQSNYSIIPTLGVYVAASFRLIPSIYRILNLLQVFKFMLPVVQNTIQEFETQKIKPKINSEIKKINFANKIEIKNLKFDYNQDENFHLNNINLQIKFGEIVGFVGSSGSGKTTLVDNIIGVLKPNRGQIIIDGFNIEKNIREWQKNIGYIPQKIYLTDDTIMNNIAFGIEKNKINKIAVRSAIKFAQLEEHISNLPNGLDTYVGEHGVRLSGGQLQRIGIARALYHNPKLLVLDESTNALDDDTERKIMESIKKLKGKLTIIIVAHRLSTVKYCDKLFELKNGNIIKSGSLGEFYKDKKIL